MTALERLIGTLRRTMLRAPRVAVGGRTLLDDASFFEAQKKAAREAGNAVQVAQSAGAAAQQQRSALDAVADRTEMLVQHGSDLRGAAANLKDALERIKLVALNAALDGARIGEPVGSALVLLGDEVRDLVARGLSAFEEQAALLERAESERETLRREVEEARRRSATLADVLLRAQAAQSEARSAVDDLSASLRRVTGTDPEVAAAVARAADHAAGLLDALSALSARAQGGLVLRALRPSIEPVLRVIRDLDRRDDAGRSR